MIFIQKNRTNNVILTLTEASRITNPNYLFVFQNEFVLNSTPIYWSQTDISSYPNRYNQFELVEATSGSTSGGTATSLNLIQGQYKYTVYESSTPTLDISGTTGTIIETGRMVVAFDSVVDSYENNNDDIYN
jgi:hypothetical protein